MTFVATKFGLGTGTFLDAGKVKRTMTGVALQKQNEVLGLFSGVSQTGTVEVK